MFHDRPDTMTPFSSMLGTMTRSEDDFAITLPPDWLQGRTAYGAFRRVVRTGGAEGSS